MPMRLTQIYASSVKNVSAKAGKERTMNLEDETYS